MRHLSNTSRPNTSRPNTHVLSVQLVDDHQVVRAGFRHLLEDDGGFSVLVESNDGASAESDYQAYQPDVVVMDIAMPGQSGLTTTQRILSHDPNAKIVILSMLGRDAASRALEAGAKGFLSKQSAAQELLQAIRTVQQGSRYIDSKTAQELAVESLTSSHQNRLDSLTLREYEVMLHLLNGKTPDEIGEILSLSPKTVRCHKSRFMGKLAIENMIDLTRWAIKAGLING